MNIDLKELGITLVVGAYVLYGFELLFGILFERNLFTALRNAKFVSDTGSVAVSLALSFGLGMIMESTTTFLLRGPGSSVKLFEHELQKQVIDPSSGRLTPLGLELAGNHLFSRIAGPTVEPLERSVCDANAVPSAQAALFEKSLHRLYYHSKNVLYGHQQFSHELMNVQQRLNFSSAFAGCSALLLLVFVVVGGLRAAFAWRLEGVPQRVRTAALLAVAFGVIAATSLFAYTREVGEYTRRVFGYYSSLTVEQELETQRTGPLEADPRARTDPTCMARILTPAA